MKMAPPPQPSPSRGEGEGGGDKVIFEAIVNGVEIHI
jgi:hypothetical protein